MSSGVTARLGALSWLPSGRVHQSADGPGISWCQGVRAMGRLQSPGLQGAPAWCTPPSAKVTGVWREGPPPWPSSQG